MARNYANPELCFALSADTMNACVGGVEQIDGKRVPRQPGGRLQRIAYECLAAAGDLAAQL